MQNLELLHFAIAIIVSSRIRIVHVNVICRCRKYCVGGWVSNGGEGNRGEESQNGAVGFEQGTGKDGDSLPCTKSRHSK